MLDVYINKCININNYKISYYPPAVDFDENSSSMSSSFKNERGLITWGGQSDRINNFGLVLNTDAGIGNTKCGNIVTLFFDAAQSQ